MTQDEAGVTSTELAVLMPVVIFLSLLPLQVALWWHGKQAADLAAEECVEAAQVVDADVDSAGTSGAKAVLDSVGNLTGVIVAASSDGLSVVCTITASLDFSIIGPGTVSAQAAGPIERFVPADQR